MLIAVAAVAAAQQPEPLDAEVASVVRAIAEAKTPQDAAKGLTKLFKGADRKKLEQLKQVKEDGVALRAAWDEVLLEGTPRKDTETNQKRVDLAAATRFLEFTENRLRIPLPSWWQYSVKHAWRIPSGKVSPGLTMEKVYHYSSKYGSMPISTSLKTVGGKTILSVDKESAVLSQDIVDTYLRRPVSFSALLEQEHCFLACHDEVGYSYRLVCFQRESGKKVWDSEVWDSATQVDATGSWHNYVAVQRKDERVIVIGAGVYCLYIEAFDRKTGRNEFRFANWYDEETWRYPK